MEVPTSGGWRRVDDVAVRHEHGVLGFGALLRQHRTAAGLSQEALAERAGLSTRAVSDLERGVKTRPHPATMRALADALGLDDDARAELASASRPRHPSVSRQPSDALPLSPSPIVGREREIEAGVERLRDETSRLLTVTGPGGVGKTRLSLEIARVAASAFPDGVVFVELGPLTDPSLVAPTLASALKLRQAGEQPPLEAVMTALHGKRALIVLDNCEHVLAAVRDIVASLLATLPELRILATSRPSLRVRGEQLLPLEPLRVPDPADGVVPEDLAGIPAIALFVQRARAVRPDFSLGDGNASDVVEICARLDGLPLAIELAAIRMRALSPRALASLLGERLRLLSIGPEDAPERHRTLRATVQWSYNLLTPSQQELFRRLAVFAGGCTIESATEVAADGDPFAALDGLEALVDQGLLSRIEYTDGDLRFGMLQTVREYALELLDASADAEEVRNRHARYLVALAERIGMHLRGPEPGAWLDRLEREQDNLRAALAWSLGDHGSLGEPVTALRLAAAFWPFWHMRGRLHEGHAWLERAISQGERVDPATRAGAFLMLANVANNLEDHDQAASLYGESLRLFEQIGNRPSVASAQVGIGMVATSRGDYDTAAELLVQALEYFQASGNEGASVPCLFALGRLAIAQGEYAQAMAALTRARDLCAPDDIGGRTYVSLELSHLERLRGNLDTAAQLAAACLAWFREIGERRAEASALAELGQVALARGDLAGADRQLSEAATMHLAIRDELGVVTCLEALACLAAEMHLPELSATLRGVSDTWRARSGTQRTHAERQSLDRAMSIAMQEADASEIDRALVSGAALELDAALGLADSIVTE